MLAIDDMQPATPYRLTINNRVQRFELVGHFGKLINLGRGLPLTLEMFVSEIDGRVLECREERWIPASVVESIEEFTHAR